MLPAYPINIFISNVIFTQLTENTGVVYHRDDDTERFHGVGAIKIVENVTMEQTDTNDDIIVTIVFLVLNVLCEKNRAIYGIYLTDKDNIEWFKRLKYNAETVDLSSETSMFPTYELEVAQFNLSLNGDTSLEQDDFFALLDDGKLRIPEELVESVLDEFLPNRQKELP